MTVRDTRNASIRVRGAQRSPGLLVGGLLIAIVVVAALVSFAWTPYDVRAIDIESKFLTPSWQHWLGTDHFGRDILSMIMVGARSSLAVAFVAVAIGAGIGVPAGLFAAAGRGFAGEAVMRANDVIFAFPSLLMAVMITAAYGVGALNAIVAIGIFNIPVFARVTRGAALSLWEREYILAARVAGKGAALVSVQHILPNLAGLLVVQAAIQFALAGAALMMMHHVGAKSVRDALFLSSFEITDLPVMVIVASGSSIVPVSVGVSSFVRSGSTVTFGPVVSTVSSSVVPSMPGLPARSVAVTSTS